MWADGSFSDCLAVYLAYRRWHDKRRNGHFERAVPDRRRNMEQEFCYHRFLQLKVR